MSYSIHPRLNSLRDVATHRGRHRGLIFLAPMSVCQGVRRKGANPFWYVDMTPGHTWLIRDPLNELKFASIRSMSASYLERAAGVEEATARERLQRIPARRTSTSEWSGREGQGRHTVTISDHPCQRRSELCSP
jgi:hypothetical protein